MDRVDHMLRAKIIERRFGTVAVRMGLVTREQLFEAMRVQVEKDLDGEEHRLIGSILYSMDLLTTSQIDEVLKALLKLPEKTGLI